MPVAKSPRPIFFVSPTEFRRWLEQYHESKTELWVGFYKVATGRPSMTWSESVDEALCFGWIDGVRKSVNAEGYMIRFTPRKRGSVWSLVNIRKVEGLTRDGRMRPAGLEAFRAMEPEKAGAYSFERGAAAFTSEEERHFRRHRAAWRFFETQPPGYRKTVTWWVASAKQAATRARRLQTLINDSAAGQRIAALRRNTGK